MSEHTYRHVAKFATETPWAIMPETLRILQDVLSARLAGERWSDAEIEARIEAAGGRRPTRVVSQTPGGVAVVPLSGVIVPRANVLSQLSGGTSVQDFTQAMSAAVADPDVGAVVIDVDSPGGSTDLVTEAAQKIRQMRGKKPILAVADTLMASAAYHLASQADEIAVTPSGLAGSIGVYAMHTDMSGANEKLGLKPTLIKAGRFKTEGNPHEPLTDEALAHIQELVDAAYQTFTADVAKGRGVTVDQVRNGFGEGRVLPPKQAVSAGIADRVATLDDTVGRAASLAAGRDPATSSYGGFNVSAGPIKPHSTDTTDEPWDGPAQKANLANDKPETYRQAYAWYDSDAPDPDGDGYPDNKGDYKFIHHEVAEGGDVGAANVTGCDQVIANLNGARTAPNIPNGDRQGVYDHVARHLKDAGRDPAPLKSLTQIRLDATQPVAGFAEEVDRALCVAEGLVEQGRPLTAAKRERLEALRDRLAELTAPTADAEESVAATTADALSADDEYAFGLTLTRIPD